MDQLEKVEKLREKANVTYDEAKQALEACNWDILDAMVYLEKLGKVNGPETSSYNTNQQSNGTSYQQTIEYTTKRSNFGDTLGRFFSWCGKVVKKGMENCLVIEKQSMNPVSIPVIIFILLLIVAFWVVVPLLVIGLFFGFRYSFRGPGMDLHSVNDVLDKASKGAEDFKEDFKNGYNK